MQIVGTARHGSQLNDLVRDTSPDVVILDPGMFRGAFESVPVVQQLLSEHPEAKVLILTANDSVVDIRDLLKSAGSSLAIDLIN
jgi:DNA-binding NarL/FixJ family response regulator